MDEFEDAESEPTFYETYGNGGTWNISGSSSVTTARETLDSTSDRPDEVVITGSDFDEPSLLRFLSRISHVNCQLRLIPLDSFFISNETTKQRLLALQYGKMGFVNLISYVNTNSHGKIIHSSTTDENKVLTLKKIT